MQEKFNSEKHLVSWNENGTIDTVMAQEKVILETSVGDLVPRYNLDEQNRKKRSPVKFYKSGELKSLPLEDPTIITTSLGDIKCELVTFYRSGSVWRVFPLDGKITGFWTEENEYKLAEPLEIPTSQGTIAVKPIYLQFYETGELESILFWSKEQVDIVSPVGNVPIRKGICFYKSGKIKGFEPAKEISIETPLGKLNAFDPDPNGMQAEKHSLTFYEDGSMQNVMTPSSQIKVIQDGKDTIFSPTVVHSYCNEGAFFISPLRISFTEDTVTFSNDGKPAVTVARSSQFTTSAFIPLQTISCVGCE